MQLAKPQQSHYVTCLFFLKFDQLNVDMIWVRRALQ